ncbi:beta-carotene 15,15'-monooxygenase [Halobacteriales archaeon QS_4_69_34]|nr:MAG: beta-carotene 15,15'-monooxygenase [Halobacteriales archaeon QS_4_69_34]
MALSAPGFPLPVRRTLSRAVRRPSWLALGGLAALSVFGIAPPERVGYLVLLASALAFGLPHGAIDHLALARIGVARSRPLVATGLLYALAGGAYVVFWAFAPAPAFVLFVALTWAHWGQGDLHAALAFAGRTHLRTRGQRALCLVVRGGLPMLVPLLAFPGVYETVAREVVAVFDPAAARALAAAVPTRPGVRRAAGLAFGSLSVAALALGYVRAASLHGTGTGDGAGSEPGTATATPVADAADARRAWRIDAAETLLLWTYFLAVPPVLAIGLYFPLWHSLRHVARLVALDGSDALRRGAVGPAFARFAREAAPLTAVAACLLVALSVVRPPATLAGVAARYLVVLAALTPPHVAVVAAMDRAQGVWMPAPTAR